MDAAVHLAIEEICCEAASGLRIRDLWEKLGPFLKAQGLPPCPGVKRAVWENLVRVPGLKFEGIGLRHTAEDFVKLTAEECEEMNVKVVAMEAMRKSFLGVYEIDGSESSLSDIQRSILERLAIARTRGITQNDLTNELGCPANKLFYPLKRLETQGLIVRQPTVIKKKKVLGSRDPNNFQIISTNTLYLPRYAKHLGCQRRLEITMEDKVPIHGHVLDSNSEAGDDFNKATGEGDVHVKDFLPAMKAICDKLEKAQGKVLVISDLKRDLGYHGKHAQGHRAWRNICHRLKDARLIEECSTMINSKETKCVRLLQSFSPSHFEAKHPGRGHYNDDEGQPIDFLKRGQITEQLVEVPILTQIYDMIDAAGPEGLTNTEVCRRLGLCAKEYHKRYFQQMISRFGLHLQPEGQNRGEVYRVWTPGNYKQPSNMQTVGKGNVRPYDNESSPHAKFPFPAQGLDTSALVVDAERIKTTDRDVVVIEEPAEGTKSDGEISPASLFQGNGQNSDGFLVEEPLKVTASLTNDHLPKKVTYSRKRLNPRYPRVTVAAASSRREELIIKMLQEEKFLINAELIRRLNDLDKAKNTSMDRKTLERSLNKLQQEGHCKCTTLSIPADTNCSGIRTTNVVLLPSCVISPELLCQIHERFRSFSMQSRQQKKAQATTILDDVERIPRSVSTDDRPKNAEFLQTNTLPMAKMVQARLLHTFLWGWIHSSPGWNYDSCNLKNLQSSYKMFELHNAIQSIPLGLFSQIIGSLQRSENIDEIYSSDLLLSDIPIEKYRILMDTQATGRLSRLIDILRRLKLIRLVGKTHDEDGNLNATGSLSYALEFKPYIEEPVSIMASSCSLSLDLRPQVRHDFVLLNDKAIDEYWNTLEYCYAASKPRSAALAFPGSKVRDVFRLKSWGSSLVMTSEQRVELLKCIAKYDTNKKLSLIDCEKIAKDLDLTIGQVLHFYNEKMQRARLKVVEDTQGQEVLTDVSIHSLASRKRRKYLDGLSSKKSRISEDVDSLSDFTKEISHGPDTALSSLGDFCCSSKNITDDILGLESNDEDKDAHGSNGNQAPSTLCSSRQKRFIWTEESDRQLIIEYATQRAAQGLKFRGVNWSSISNIPAPRAACERRIALLNRHIPFREALMKLCNLLAERYAKILENSGEKMSNIRSSMVISDKWADIEDNTIKVALNDALRHKRMADLDSVNASTSSKIHQSVAIANAVELFKLIFLSNSKAPEMPNLLAETLRRYAENDLSAAFDYLREKKIIIGGSCGSPFALSRHFLYSISVSFFPKDTGKRAADFITWLSEREKDLMVEGIDVPINVQCGEVYTLCALLASGELSVTPCLPNEGVGESEDSRTSKRKCCTGEQEYEQLFKRSKTALPGEGEIISRREKGFPGIRLCLLRETISKSLAIDFNSASSSQDQSSPTSILDPDSDETGCVGRLLNSAEVFPREILASESSWENMASYARCVIASCSDDGENSSLHPNSFRTLYSAIQRAGDNGLSLQEIRDVLNKDDAVHLDIMVDALVAFGRVLKVNAYDGIHVMDSFYRSKYFLMPADDRSSKNHERQIEVLLDHSEIALKNADDDDDEVHRVTILNHSGDVKCSSQHSVDPQETNRADEGDVFFKCQKKQQPLVPWTNGDGTMNEAVYEGLRRCILGIVFQNPGILEESIINQMQGLTPQSCRELLEIMRLDNQIVTREMVQKRSSCSPPSILRSLLVGGSSSRKPGEEEELFVSRLHYFANPMSITLL